MDENKKVLLSGKLSGTRTFATELEAIETPDDIEKFLLFFANLTIDKKDLDSKQVIYIYNDTTFSEASNLISNNEYISIYNTDDFSKLYITTEDMQTYIIDLGSISSNLLGNFISKETPMKYCINSFNFIKWCNAKNIDIKSLYDIPTYIKLLTNNVDPFKAPYDYLISHSTYTLENDDSKNEIAISNFTLKFGNILSEHINKFDLATVSRLINENSYYEGKKINQIGNCLIIFSYKNIDEAISNIEKNILEKYENKAYIISPLNRIAPKYKYNTSSLIYEIYSEDLSTTILNELYNNNIPVKIDYENNKYIITCSFKNYMTTLNILLALFTEIFSTLFDQHPEIHFESIIKTIE